MSVNKQLREMALPIFFSIAQFWYGLPTSFQFYDPAACTAVLTVAPFHFFKHISGTVQFAAVLERTWDESIFKLSKVKDIVVEDQQKYSARTGAALFPGPSRRRTDSHVVRKDITIVRDLQDKTASYKHFAIKVTACLTYEVFWTHANSTVTVSWLLLGS